MGQVDVSGDAYVEASFRYSYSHIWRNLGIVIGFWIFFLVTYLVATELNSYTSSAAEVLVFRRRHLPTGIVETGSVDENVENGRQEIVHVPQQRSVFTWHDVVYDIHIKDEPRRLLDHVSGWAKPGTLTILMG